VRKREEKKNSEFRIQKTEEKRREERRKKETTDFADRTD